MIQTLLLAVALQQPTATGTVRGVVLSPIDSLPLKDAIVDIPMDRVKRSAFTDARGAFVVSGIEAGTYWMKVRRIGYPSYRKHLYIAAHDTVTLTIVLGGHCTHDSATAVRDIARHRLSSCYRGALPR